MQIQVCLIFAVIAHDNKELALVLQNVWLDWRSAFGLCSLLICTRSACLNERVCTYRKKAHAWPPTLWRPKMSQRRAQTVVVFYLFTLLICSASVGFNECAFARTNDVYAWFATLLHPMMPQRWVRNTYTTLCGIQWWHCGGSRTRMVGIDNRFRDENYFDSLWPWSKFCLMYYTNNNFTWAVQAQD